MLSEQRYAMILELLEEKRSITVIELTKLLNISESTARRDITALDKAGRLVKVFGGAVAAENTFLSLEPTVAQKSEVHKAEKMQIAPESLSRAINGNPQLSTIQAIAKNLNVEVADLFKISLDQNDLTAIVVFRGKTLVTDNINSLLDYAIEIKESLQSEKITEYDINGKYPAK